uniref:AlNc14C60G4410 protein n=1 Tax=Albugo laibachii Nc14 TaxID=890382 RepID=F0WCM6_9STRA|nr:AlNc14C60G4410 [Albugo laibachii Nc14]|eukprot:CCA18947.1 AlNc14C60G4410 [Albugo laibachii Nc14]
MQPNIILCIQPSCGAVEVDQHLFFDCDHTAQLFWNYSRHGITFFSSRPRWTNIACAIVPPVRTEWKEYQQILSDLWLALQTVTLHFIWSDRNRILFDNRPPTPTIPALSVIYTTFSAHVRYFRRQCYDEDDRIQLAKVLDQLSKQDILKGKEEIRKDKAAKQAQFKAAMPKRLVADLRAIEKLSANERPSWDVLSTHLTVAKPFVVPGTKFSMVLETGEALAGTPPTQILESFARDHGNLKVEILFTQRAIGQLAKLPGGNLRLLVTSEKCVSN